jgi:hypothetical protein
VYNGLVALAAGDALGRAVCAKASPVAQIVTKIDNVRILVLKLKLGLEL